VEGDLVIVHGRFSDFGVPVNWIPAVRIQNGILVAHWDVIQDEATEEHSISKRPMFGTTFPTYACQRLRTRLLAGESLGGLDPRRTAESTDT
jgi:hypothetical protein